MLAEVAHGAAGERGVRVDVLVVVEPLGELHLRKKQDIVMRLVQVVKQYLIKMLYEGNDDTRFESRRQANLILFRPKILKIIKFKFYTKHMSPRQSGHVQSPRETICPADMGQ